MDPIMSFGLFARPPVRKQSSASAAKSKPTQTDSLQGRGVLTPMTSAPASESSASPSGPSSASTPLTASPSAEIPSDTPSASHGRSKSMASSSVTPASLQSPYSQNTPSSLPFGHKAENRPRPSPSTSTNNTGSTNSFFDDHSPHSRPSSRVDPNVLRRSRSGGRSPSISSSHTSNAHANNSTRSIPNPAANGSSEIRIGYLSAMDTIKYIGKDKAADVALALRVLAPFCDLLHERLAWTTSSSPSSSVSGFRRGGPVQLPDVDVVIVGKPSSEEEAQSDSASRTEKNRRAAILSAGLREEDLPPPERVAYGILRDYTMLKMSRHSSGGRASLGRSSPKVMGPGGAGLPMLKPKEAAEVGVKLEALEESLASYGYLPLFDLVRWQCYLPPRLASPFHFSPVSPPSTQPYSHSHTHSHSHSASASVSSLSGHRSPHSGASRPIISTNIMEAFDLVGPSGQRRRGSDGQVSLSNGHSSVSPRTPEKTGTHSSADSRHHASDSIGKAFKLNPFGMGGRSSKSRSGSSKESRLPSHRSTSSIVDLASDDEEFGSPGPMPEDLHTESPEGEVGANNEDALRKTPSMGGLRQSVLPPSSYKPLTRSASDNFYIPGSGSTSTTSLNELAAGNAGAGSNSSRHNQVVLPSGPSAFRLPIARQDSTTFGMVRQRSASSPGLALADSDNEAAWTGTNNSPANDLRNPFDSQANGMQTPPDLSVPPRARRRELLIAAGLTPAPETEGGQTTPLSSPPPLPNAPMPTGINASLMPLTGVRRPRARAASVGSSGSSLADGDKESRRRAIIIFDQTDVVEESPSSVDSSRTFSGEGTLDFISTLATLGVTDENENENLVGVAVSSEDSPYPARPGRIKTAEQMLAALTSRRSSLGPNEAESATTPGGTSASTHLASGPSAMALRRLSDLLEEEDGEEGEVSLHRHFREEAARRHTANTQASAESHSTTSPSMTTDSSSNRNSMQFSSGSHEYCETFPSSGFPQTPQHPVGFSSAYGREEDGTEAGKQMLYEVFGDTWDDGSEQDDLTEVYGRIAQGQATRSISHVKKSGPADTAMYGKGRPESMAYPGWV